jgi:hypothetical protein
MSKRMEAITVDTDDQGLITISGGVSEESG